ncbi:hypothetical protein [Flammeovirga sp. SubArs3]|uniref:hypothetical protein n=1 Tax=Flammeovirga sp. SubArs3 TaxID=2995316 RepID=UPI00248B2CA8|nr:hypothetical protein [Flammeovirga sp. SubArs3]
MYFLFLLPTLFLSLLSTDTHHIKETKLLFEVINHDAQHINNLHLEIHDQDGLIVSLHTKKITAISLPRKDYELKVFYCDEVYSVDTKLFQPRHHIVFVVDEKSCSEPILYTK